MIVKIMKLQSPENLIFARVPGMFLINYHLFTLPTSTEQGIFQ